MQDFIKGYLDGLKKAMEGVDEAFIAQVITLISDARENGKRIYAIGNGGSASTASHFVNDMGKGASFGREKRFKMIPLTDNVEWMTALSNDDCYENVYAEQLKNHAEAGDVLIAISGSGNSENILRAVSYANEVGCHTVGLCGFDGGKLKDLAKLSTVIGGHHMGHSEDLHLIVLHVVGYYFMGEKACG